MSDPLDRVIVVIPTYNERDNIEQAVQRVVAAVPSVNVLVVDDASPDGTGELADALAAEDERVRVMHRTAKDGLGAAYLAGFAEALAGDYGVIVEMDADGSHAPEDLPALLARLRGGAGTDGADLVLGSRYVPGGRVRNWPAHRFLLSKGANVYARVALGVPIRDITAGFRAFRRQVLEELDLKAVQSQGYCFQIDMAWRVVQAGFRVAEVPITFTERERGASKMDRSVMVEAFWRVGAWGVERVRDKRRTTKGAVRA
jgi:dolichol-phosphate mannosyltransferase